jgi:murein DD-endopeptidase MepM/ murein hydrolase activator NlpD
MATEAGSAFARFYLDLRGLRSDADEARNIISTLRNDLARQMSIPISFTTDMSELNAFIQGIRTHIAKEFSTEIEQPVVTRRRGGRGGAAAEPTGEAAAAAAGRPGGPSPLAGTALEAALEEQIAILRRDASARQVIARKLYEEEEALEDETDALKERARLIRAAGRYIGPGADLPEPGRMKRETEEARATLGPDVDVSEAAIEAARLAAKEANERLTEKTRERQTVNDRAIDLEIRANALQDQLNDIREQRVQQEQAAAAAAPAAGGAGGGISDAETRAREEALAASAVALTTSNRLAAEVVQQEAKRKKEAAEREHVAFQQAEASTQGQVNYRTRLRDEAQRELDAARARGAGRVEETNINNRLTAAKGQLTRASQAHADVVGKAADAEREFNTATVNLTTAENLLAIAVEEERKAIERHTNLVNAANAQQAPAGTQPGVGATQPGPSQPQPQPNVPVTNQATQQTLDATAANQANATSIQQVAGATQNLIPTIEKETQALARAAEARRDYAEAIRLYRELEEAATNRGDSARASNLEAHISNLERRGAALESDRAISRARLEASTGDYAAALERLFNRLQQLTRGSDEAVRIEQAFHEIMRQGTRDAYQFADALTSLAAATGGPGAALAQVQTNIQETPVGDTERMIALHKQQAKLVEEITAEFSAEQQQLMKNALASGDFATAIATVDTRLQNFNLSVKEELALLGLRENLVRQAINAEVDADITTAKRLAGNAEYAKALNILQAQLTTLTVDTQEYLAVEKALIQITDQMVTAEQKHEDALVQTALTQRDLTAALAANRAAQAQTDPTNPAHQGRRDQLAKQEADINRRMADDAIRRERSELQLLVQQGKMAEAVTLVDNALTRSLPGQTAHNNLLRQRTRILQEVEGEIRQMALTAIRDANNAGDTALAHQRLNKELERQRVLSKDLGGLGGQAIAPLGQTRHLVGASGAGAETTADIDRLLAMRTQIGNKEEQIQRRLADEAVKRERSEIRLLVSQNKIADAIRIVDAALTRALPHDTAYNTLLRERNRILQEAEDETRQMARAAIADAKAAGNQTEALQLLNKELERQRVLSKDLGGLGGGQIVPLGQPRRLLGTAGTDPESTADIDRLLVMQRQIQQMPTFASRAMGALTRVVGPVALVNEAMELLRTSMREVIEGFEDLEQITLTERTMGALFNSIDRGNRVMEEAIEFGRQYGFTQREMAEAAGDAAILFQTSNLEVGKGLEILLRLQTRAPEKRLQDAVRSLNELQAGQVQSLQRVFNVPQRMTQEMAAAIKAGEEPLKVVDRALTQLGQTSDVLDARMGGLTLSFNAVRTAYSDMRIALVEPFEGPVIVGANALAEVMERTAIVLRNTLTLYRNVQASYAAGGNQLDQIGMQWEAFMANLNGTEIELTEVAKAQHDLNTVIAQSKGFQEFFNPTSGGGGASDELKSIADRFGVIFARYTQEQINAAQAVEQLAAARKVMNDQDRDAAQGERVLATARTQSNGDHLREYALLRQGAQLFMNELGKDPNIGDKVGADLDVVMRRMAELDRLHPVITVEVRMAQASLSTTFYQNIAQEAIRSNKQITDENRRFTDELADLHAKRAENTRNYIRSVNEATSEFNKQRRRENADFERDMALAAAEFVRSQAQSRTDFAEQQARGAADFARGQAREDEDRARALARKARDRQQQDERDEREHQRSILQAREEFNRERVRSEEDFQDEYRGLLATGRRAEAEVALFRFNRDQRRGGEDFARTQADAERNRAATIEERNRQRAQEDADEREDFEYRRQQANADFARTQAQAAADFEKQFQQREVEFARQQQQQRDNLAYQQARADEDFAATLRKMKAEYKGQQDELDSALDKAREAHKTNITNINADYVQYVKDQEKILTDGNARLFAVEALKAKGIAEKEAEAIVALEFAMSEYDRVLKTGEGIFAQTGTQAGTAYVEGLAKGILDSLRNTQMPFVPPPGFYDQPTYAQPGGGTGGGSFSAGSRIGSRYIPGNFNPADDPRPSDTTVKSLFGNQSAYVKDTYDSSRAFLQDQYPDIDPVHRGLDVIMTIGSTVRAPLDLMITKVYGDQYASGVTVMATDSKGRQWLFAHFGKVFVKRGDLVPKGAPMGLIGQEAHIHVQLRKGNDNSTPIDPSQALEEEAARSAGAPHQVGGAAASLAGPGPQDMSVLVGPASAVGVSATDIARLQAALEIIVEPPDRTVNVAVTIPPITMDGQAVGHLTAPIAYDYIVEDFRVAVSVTEASQVPTLKQSSFRGVR